MLATRYLDAFHYAKDGNFVLCQHSKRLDMDDSPLTDGAAYYVDNGKYADYSNSVKDDADAQRPVRTAIFRYRGFFLLTAELIDGYL